LFGDFWTWILINFLSAYWCFRTICHPAKAATLTSDLWFHKARTADTLRVERSQWWTSPSWTSGPYGTLQQWSSSGACTASQRHFLSRTSLHPTKPGQNPIDLNPTPTRPQPTWS
jgi:hypothetical protein